MSFIPRPRISAVWNANPEELFHTRGMQASQDATVNKDYARHAPRFDSKEWVSIYPCAAETMTVANLDLSGLG
ncbi:hypothetical protein TNCT_485091 [Trichonephila clavata]|uniref:Uncharacterized protein n=1 Tax=Trichonephila clavata TaxID=2740835 RepID=A0A8X6KIB8_TRICU|nr:hypothetical protein TNCT_485091 [Trichonephila clavata]